MKPQIDPEFRSQIPPLSAEERDQLKANIAAEGCRDALVLWNDILLDGHNRLEICEEIGKPYKTVSIKLADRDAALEWIIRNQFGRRNLTTFSRAELALKLEPLLRPIAKESQKRKPKSVSQKLAKQTPKDTRAEVAKAAGVSHETIRAAKFVQEHADEETKAKLRTDPNIKLHRVAKDLRETQQHEEREAKRNEAAKDTQLDSHILVGDFRELADKIPDGSISLIFTDPPYSRKAAEIFPELGDFAARKLAEGGSLICYVGHIQLRQAINDLSDHLRHWWTIACVHSGGSTVMREYGINACWKPVLWFVKGTRDNKADMVNDVMSGGKEKDHHDWQQASAEAQYWIGKLCPATAAAMATGGTASPENTTVQMTRRDRVVRIPAACAGAIDLWFRGVIGNNETKGK